MVENLDLSLQFNQCQNKSKECSTNSEEIQYLHNKRQFRSTSFLTEHLTRAHRKPACAENFTYDYIQWLNSDVKNFLLAYIFLLCFCRHRTTLSHPNLSSPLFSEARQRGTNVVYWVLPSIYLQPCLWLGAWELFSFTNLNTNRSSSSKAFMEGGLAFRVLNCL